MTSTDGVFRCFVETYPHLVTRLRNTHHSHASTSHNPYHLEGDVWSHTCAVSVLSSTFSIDPTVFLSCLLHDIAKPMVRVEKMNNGNTRTHFKNHDLFGVVPAYIITKLLPAEFGSINPLTVAKLVGLHMKVIDLTQSLMDQEPNFPMISAMSRLLAGSPLTFVDQLLQVSAADIAGRFGLVPVKRRLLAPGSALSCATDLYGHWISQPFNIPLTCRPRPKSYLLLIFGYLNQREDLIQLINSKGFDLVNDPPNNLAGIGNILKEGKKVAVWVKHNVIDYQKYTTIGRNYHSFIEGIGVFPNNNFEEILSCTLEHFLNKDFFEKYPTVPIITLNYFDRVSFTVGIGEYETKSRGGVKDEFLADVC
ncbi:hypothetical protein P9112_010176 [Eukaryota sp. TZLM1-RC]